jgi:hypothetical protein
MTTTMGNVLFKSSPARVTVDLNHGSTGSILRVNA